MAGDNVPSSSAALDSTAQQNSAKLQASSTLDPDHASNGNGTHITVSLIKEPKDPSPAKENGSLHTVRPQPHGQHPGQPSTVNAGPQAQALHISTDHGPAPTAPAAVSKAAALLSSQPAEPVTAPSRHVIGASDANQSAEIGNETADKGLSHQHAPPASREPSVSRVDIASAASASTAEAASHPPSTRLLPAGAVAIPLPAVATSGALPAPKSAAAPASTIHPVAAFQQLQYQQQQRQQQQQQQSRQHSSGQNQTLFLPTIQQQLRLETQMRTQQAQQVQQALQAGAGNQTSLQQHPHAQQATSLQQQAGQNRAGMHLLTNQQHPRMAVAMQPRLTAATSGWPVPLPKTMTGGSCMTLYKEPRHALTVNFHIQA